MRDNHVGWYKIVPTWGATEAFLPEDADMLIENTQTGTTLALHNLVIIDTLFHSTACLIGNKKSLKSAAKKEKITYLVELFEKTAEKENRSKMKIVKGYSQAKPLLDRTLPFARSCASFKKVQRCRDVCCRPNSKRNHRRMFKKTMIKPYTVTRKNLIRPNSSHSRFPTRKSQLHTSW